MNLFNFNKKTMVEKLAITQVEIASLIAKRWSPRAFDNSKPIEPEKIIALCEAARWACSCYNDQPWRFIFWNKFDNPDAYQKAFNCLDEWNQKWVVNAPLLIASIAGSKFIHNGKPNRWGQYDTGAATINLCLQAFAMGLYSHQMGGFSMEKLRQEFNIPVEFTPMAMIAVGYPAEPKILEEEYYKLEIKERARKPLGFNFYKDGWNMPIIEV